MKDHALLDAATERRLIEDAQAGDRVARGHMIEHNVRLAMKVARQFAANDDELFHELTNEGVIGLDRAITKFKLDSGNRFSTYATWWVYHFIQRAVRRQARVKLPESARNAAKLINRYMHDNPGASFHEAADAVGVNPEEAELAQTRLVSFYSSNDDGESELQLHDEDAERAFDAVGGDHPELAAALDELNSDERRVIELRFGIAAPTLEPGWPPGSAKSRPHSRDEIAERLGVRPSAVQRLQLEALRKLREAMCYSSESDATTGHS